MAKWLIDSFEVSGGFLAGMTLRLPPRLTCIIGPRGSGKSTLAEAVRFALLGMSNLPKNRADLVQANLGSAFVTLQTSPDQRGEYFTIRRGHKQAASLTSSTSRSLTDIDLDRGTFLPLDAYSSAEIEAIADESLGHKRRALLDDLIGDDLRQVELALGERRRALESNADAIRAGQRAIADITERIEEIGDARGRLTVLPPLPTGEEPSGVAKATKQQEANEEEIESLQEASERLFRFRDELTQLVRGHAQMLRKPLAVADSRNIAHLQSADGLLAKAVADVEVLSQQQVDALDGATRELQKIRETLVIEHAAQKAEFDKIQQSNLAASQAVQRRSAAEKEVEGLCKLESERKLAIANLRELQQARASLKAEYLQETERISRMRGEVAARLQEEAGGRVRIRVLENADQLEYRQMLTSGLRGARVRNHEDILDVLMRLRPDELAQMMQDNDSVEFDRHTSFGAERSAKILAAFRESLDPFSLELVSLNDHIRIELDVSSGEDPIFKDASELSRGQKCTALLPILLARRDSPLLIDQPEDNLDNHFIYETVVDAIRRLKMERQLVFITHNANIPVLGEAELIVVLNSDGSRGYVEKTGDLDECRGEIIDLLEGGEEAFELRRQRYAR